MIEIRQEGDAGEQIRQLMAAMTDLTPILPRLGEHLAESQKRNIEESRSPDGQPFAPLKNPREAGHPYGDKPLLDTTTMYQSIHYEIRSPVEVFAGPSLVDADYFPLVNQGHSGVPARTFIGVRLEDQDRIEELIAEHIRTSLEAGQ